MNPLTTWESHHPGTDRVTETDTLPEALWWFLGQTVEWLALRWVVPVVALLIIAVMAIRQGVRS